MTPFESLCLSSGLEQPIPEFRFAPPRKWRFDWCWPDSKIALEVEGGIWTRGRHTRGAGFLKDLEKYSEAAILGWTVIRVTPDMMNNGKALEILGRLFNARK